MLPRGYNPFGIQTLNDMVCVTYAKTQPGSNDERAGRGRGVVDAFETHGTFRGRVATHGRPDGRLKDAHRKPVVIDGLWAIAFGGGLTEGNNGSANTLFFTAGPNGEQDGAFGTVTVAP
jgi:hypothetical protein